MMITIRMMTISPMMPMPVPRARTGSTVSPFRWSPRRTIATARRICPALGLVKPPPALEQWPNLVLEEPHEPVRVVARICNRNALVAEIEIGAHRLCVHGRIGPCRDDLRQVSGVERLRRRGEVRRVRKLRLHLPAAGGEAELGMSVSQPRMLLP